MKLTKKLLLLFILLVSVIGYAQEEEEPTQKYYIYTDFIENEQGERLQGVTVRVIGGDSDTTDGNGNFSIRARYGDSIEVLLNNKKIDSYIYNGKDDYIINDYNDVFSSKSVSKLSYEMALDSAKYYSKKQALKSIQFVELALKSTSNKKKEAKVFEVLADAFYELNQFDLAQSNYLTAYETFPKAIPLQLKIAKVYYKNSHFSKASNFYNKVLLNKKATPIQKINALEGLASLAKRNNKNSFAISYLNKALKIAETHLVTPKITRLNTKLAEVLSSEGNADKSKIYISNSIVSAKKESKSKAISQTNKVADYYGNQNEIEQEVVYRKQTLSQFEADDVKEIEISKNKTLSKSKVKYDLGKALVKQKKYKEAITYFTESADEAKTGKDIEIEKDAVRGLSEVYAVIGNDKKAISNYNRLSKLVDFSFKNKEKEIKRAIAISKDIANKQNRIRSLETNKALTLSKYELSVSDNKRQKLIIYSLIGGVLLLLISLFYMFKSNKQRKLNNNLLALKSLRSQMNPHFIFNALNSVNSYISNNDERMANRFLTDFSTLMRSVLENSEKDFIPLEKEIELLNLYLKLEHSRFEDKFDYEFNIDKSIHISDFTIPPMLLQPYVENAIWHGLRYKKEKGLLQINITKDNDETLQVVISDNGIGREKSKTLKSTNQQKNKSKGMQNIKQRVAILNEMYKDKVDVVISDLSNDKTGTKVILTLKKD